MAFRVGQRVRHADAGEGVVLRIDGGIVHFRIPKRIGVPSDFYCLAEFLEPADERRQNIRAALDVTGRAP